MQWGVEMHGEGAGATIAAHFARQELVRMERDYSSLLLLGGTDKGGLDGHFPRHTRRRS